MPRQVRLVLCAETGTVLGALPGFEVSTPWWPDVEPVVAGAKERFGVDVLVLRLLETDADPAVMGGAITYLAEVLGAPPRPQILTGVDPDVLGGEQLLRAPWARPGGVRRQIAWADARLEERGRPRVAAATQVKSWNLSSVLRLPTTSGDVWCKQVPSFLAHEGTIIEMVAAERPLLAPHVVAMDPEKATVLMEDVPGDDQWDAPAPVLRTMVRALVALQDAWAGRVDELLAAGLPDRRAPALLRSVWDLLARDDVRARLDDTELTGLDRLVEDLPRRLAAMESCGLPDTLVHGDFHPGNWRSDGAGLVLMDWGDTEVGHPLLDLDAFLDRVSEDVRGAIRDAWFAAWIARRPEADPARAAELIAPLSALRSALIYRGFLDGIEPNERRYHETDVPDQLRRALG